MVRRDKTAKLFIEMLSPGESEVIYIDILKFSLLLILNTSSKTPRGSASELWPPTAANLSVCERAE